MKTRKLLRLERSDLLKDFRYAPFESIERYHVSYDCNKIIMDADFVVFSDGENSKIWKDRDGDNGANLITKFLGGKNK